MKSLKQLTVVILISFFSSMCSPSRNGCPATRGLGGYSLRQALIDDKKQMYDTAIADLNVHAIPGYTYIGTSNVEYTDGAIEINDKAKSYFYRNTILFPKCAVKWCTNVSAYSYLDGTECCCQYHSEQ